LGYLWAQAALHVFLAVSRQEVTRDSVK